MKFYVSEIYYNDGWILDERKFNYNLDSVFLDIFNNPSGGRLYSLFPLSEDQKNKFLSYMLNDETTVEFLKSYRRYLIGSARGLF